MKRNVALFGALIAVLAGLALVLGRGTIAKRAFETALENNVAVDQSLALDDGLHAYVCGSGSPMPDADRAGPCIAVLAGREGFVFDAGSGSIRKLQRMGFPMDRLQAVFLTHLHSDHIDGMGELLLQAWVGGGRGVPLPVYGPEGTDQVVAGLMQAYRIDSGYRIAHHGPEVARPGGFGGIAQVYTCDDAGADCGKVVYELNGVTIRTTGVNHDPVKGAVAYRIDYKGRSIAISGDTTYSAAFVNLSKRADLMFHEALNNQMVGAIGQKLAERGRKDAAKIMTDIPGYHASPEDAARAAKEAGAKTLVLYHLVPAVPSKAIEPLFLGDAPKLFPGVKLAHDGMIVSLPASGGEANFSDGF
jgi:ribonuclease Z